MRVRDDRSRFLLAVVAVTSVIGAIIILTQPIEIDFVQNDAQKVVVNTAGRVESMFHDVNFCFSPFNDEYVKVDKVSSCTNIYHRSNRREVDNHIVIPFLQSGE